jgi:hypothetical protein
MFRNGSPKARALSMFSLSGLEQARQVLGTAPILLYDPVRKLGRNLDVLEQLQGLWNILGTKPSVYRVIFSSFQPERQSNHQDLWSGRWESNPCPKFGCGFRGMVINDSERSKGTSAAHLVVPATASFIGLILILRSRCHLRCLILCQARRGGILFYRARTSRSLSMSFMSLNTEGDTLIKFRPSLTLTFPWRRRWKTDR